MKKITTDEFKKRWGDVIAKLQFHLSLNEAEFLVSDMSNTVGHNKILEALQYCRVALEDMSQDEEKLIDAAIKLASRAKGDSSILGKAAMSEYWKMNDGTRILVSEMSENHAKNALASTLKAKRIGPDSLDIECAAAEIDDCGSR